MVDGLAAFAIFSVDIYLAVYFIKKALEESFRIVAFDGNSKTVGIHVIDHHIIVFPQDAHDLGALILLAINPVIFHNAVFLIGTDAGCSVSGGNNRIKFIPSPKRRQHMCAKILDEKLLIAIDIMQNDALEPQVGKFPDPGNVLTHVAGDENMFF